MILEFKTPRLAEKAYREASARGYSTELNNKKLTFESSEYMEDFLLEIDTNTYQLDNSIETNYNITENTDIGCLRKLSGIKIEPIQHRQPTLHSMKNMLEQYIQPVAEKSIGDLFRQAVNPKVNKIAFAKAKEDYLSLMSRGNIPQGLAITRIANEYQLSPREFQNWLKANGVLESIGRGYDDVMRQVMRVTEQTWRAHSHTPKKTVFETVLNNRRLQNSITENNMNDWLRETRNIDLDTWLNS
jgi:phage antirepressor YoqD-like protein